MLNFGVLFAPMCARLGPSAAVLAERVPPARGCSPVAVCIGGSGDKAASVSEFAGSALCLDRHGNQDDCWPVG